MNGVIMGVKGFLSFLSAPLIGALSDVWGRKIFLFITAFFTCLPIPFLLVSIIHCIECYSLSYVLISVGLHSVLCNPHHQWHFLHHLQCGFCLCVRCDRGVR